MGSLKPLRILFNAYPTHCQGGGGAVKIRKLKEHLEKLGHRVDLFDPWRTRVRDYDLYHHFSWFPSDLPMLRYVQAEGVPLVLETMYWDSLGHILRSPGLPPLSRAAAFARYLAKAGFPWWAPQRRTLLLADLLMPNSAFEAGLLARHYRMDRRRLFVAPNGADRRFAEAAPEPFVQKYGLKDFVLVTGMIEARKNQLTLIRAMKGTRIPLVLIGGCPGIHRWYYERCKEAAGEDVHFLDALDHDDPLLASAYAASRALAIPSWHETTGKSALEAALAGKGVVMTTYAPAAREYLGDRVAYVDPGDPAGIRRAVLRAYETPPQEGLRRHVLEHFLWETVVKRREEGYRSLLSR